MNFKEIQELIRIVDESNLTTVEVEQEGFKIVLKKKIEQIVSPARIEASYTGQPPVSQVAVQQGFPSDATVEEDTIKSPIVGTFYSRSAPDQPSFVIAGTKVKKGSTLCIIEAMKLMNEIEAEDDALILEVLVQDGQMVEYGQPLFKISKA